MLSKSGKNLFISLPKKFDILLYMLFFHGNFQKKFFVSFAVRKVKINALTSLSNR